MRRTGTMAFFFCLVFAGLAQAGIITYTEQATATGNPGHKLLH